MGRYRGRSFIRERVHVCGEYMDTEIYPVFQAPGKRRKKCRPTSEVQARINQRNAEKRIVRLVHANFTKRDLEVGLSFDDEHRPQSVQEAEKALAKFLRKLRSLYKGRGLELKYIRSHAEEGDIGKRFHFHVFFSGGADRDEIEELWGNGYANCRRLQFQKDGLVGLARYTVKSKLAYRRYSCSRNLVRPVPAEFDGRMDRAEQQRRAEKIEDGTIHQEMEAMYPGYELVEAEYSRNEVNGCIYIRIFMRRKTEALTAGRQEARAKRKRLMAEIEKTAQDAGRSGANGGTEKEVQA